MLYLDGSRVEWLRQAIFATCFVGPNLASKFSCISLLVMNYVLFNYHSLLISHFKGNHFMLA